MAPSSRTMDKVLQQLEIDGIFSTPYHPQSNGKLEGFHQISQTHPEETMWKGPIKMGQLYKSHSRQPQIDTKPCHSRNTILLSLWERDPNLPLHQLLQPMQRFLWDAESELLNLEEHHLALAIAKEMLDKSNFQTAQKIKNREAPSFKIGDRVYFKNKQPGKWDLKWRPGYWIVCVECDGHYIHIENQANGKTRSCNVKDIVLEPLVELWNIDMQFGRAGKFINPPTNLPTITLADWRWTNSCT